MPRATKNNTLTDVEFVVGDSVLRRSQFLSQSTKDNLTAVMKRQYTGPFNISKKISIVAYQLKLAIQWKTHTTFHISKLRKLYLNDKSHDQISTHQPYLLPITYNIKQNTSHVIAEQRKESKSSCCGKYFNFISKS